MNVRIAWRRVGAAIVTASIVAGTIGMAYLGTALPARAATVCATPGKDGSPGTLTGVYDAYFQPAIGTYPAGSTSITLANGPTSPDTTGGGAATAITAGDLLLVIQMQDGSFNATNGTAYGDGSSGTGYTALSSAGLYEYVAVTSVAGNTVNIQGTGSGGGLINTYHEEAATGTSGQETFQVVRVPQYVTATLSSNFTGAYWDGVTGGVAALDIASTLNLGGANLYVTGDGFSGGGVTVATTSATGFANSDYVESSLSLGSGQSAPADGSKGEGIMGTPNYEFYYTNFTAPNAPTSPTVVNNGADGYPGGDQGRGAPGNAGGGGTDEDPVSNDQNTGGGGGGNGGVGGNGGYGWTPTYSGNTAEYVQYPYSSGTKTYSASNFHDIGGRGGGALTPSITRVFMGGGGGAGSNNNASNNNSYNNYGSSGGTGGGVLMMRIANASGTAATIYADGTTGLAPANDGGGGGGAGGTVIVTSPSTFSGITVHADGASGTTANAAPNSLTQQHGPGGGGGGGVVLTSSAVTATVNGGAAGTTTTFATNYGATAGTAGTIATVSASSIPGVSSGAECGSGTGTNTLYTGPYDSAEATYRGANLTGSFDGSVSATNNNDFIPVLIPLIGLTSVNSSTIAGAPVGNTLTFSTVPTIDVPHVLYYSETDGTSHVLTLTAQAPAGWTVTICPDTSRSVGNTGALSAAPSTANCTANGTISGATCSGGNSASSGWISVAADNPAANTYTAQFCKDHKNNTRSVAYWTQYTPSASVTAFTRYDGSIAISDDNAPASFNSTHDELYAGDIALTKSVTVVSSGCPSGVTPAYSALGVCPGGILRYTIDYRNIVAGGGLGTEGNVTAIMGNAASAAGSFAITDNGTLSGVSQTGTPNWSTFTNGLLRALSAGVSNTLCGSGTNPCGDSLAGTTFTYDAAHPSGVGATTFTATIGGTTLQLYPQNVSGTKGQGTITFAVTVK